LTLPVIELCRCSGNQSATACRPLSRNANTGTSTQKLPIVTLFCALPTKMLTLTVSTGVNTRALWWYGSRNVPCTAALRLPRLSATILDTSNGPSEPTRSSAWACRLWSADTSCCSFFTPLTATNRESRLKLIGMVEDTAVPGLSMAAAGGASAAAAGTTRISTCKDEESNSEAAASSAAPALLLLSTVALLTCLSSISVAAWLGNRKNDAQDTAADHSATLFLPPPPLPPPLLPARRWPYTLNLSSGSVFSSASHETPSKASCWPHEASNHDSTRCAGTNPVFFCGPALPVCSCTATENCSCPCCA
jgi:hypothetical protein